jgi:lipopolysaccharide/colanic/teichoic acid biosynthesis glycosyltransferase
MTSITGSLSQSNGQLTLKRGVDLIGAVVALFLLSPVILILCLLLSIDSPGNILFRQTRIGKGGLPFIMLKFRTMRNHSSEGFQEFLDQNPASRLEFAQHQKLLHDPRLTPLGKILRRSSLDEIPQLWNVLQGEMSLVGPRPFLPEQTSMYGSGYSLYIQVRPGVTGLWQISGRNLLSFQERVMCDLDYLQNWSVWLDLSILMRTVGAVILWRGAY